MSEHFSCSLSTRKDESCESGRRRSRNFKNKWDVLGDGEFHLNKKTIKFQFMWIIHYHSEMIITFILQKQILQWEGIFLHLIPNGNQWEQFSTLNLPGSHSRIISFSTSHTPLLMYTRKKHLLPLFHTQIDMSKCSHEKPETLFLNVVPLSILYGLQAEWAKIILWEKCPLVNGPASASQLHLHTRFQILHDTEASRSVRRLLTWQNLGEFQVRTKGISIRISHFQTDWSGLFQKPLIKIYLTLVKRILLYTPLSFQDEITQ